MHAQLLRRSAPVATAAAMILALATAGGWNAGTAAAAGSLNAAGSVSGAVSAVATATGTAAGTDSASKPTCAQTSRLLCTEVSDDYAAFGDNYVGHDEPSALFYSDKAGSGNQMQYRVTIPSDPPPNPIPGRSYNFMLGPAFWFGMAMCDTQSYPQQVSSCRPDSDTNITSDLARHAGTAFMELQFYPPGFVQQFNGLSCDATRWCVALNIDSLSEDPVHGTNLNTTCQNQILGGLEYVNFAYLTRSGKPQGPPNPLQFDPVASGTPNPAKVLFLRSGDKVAVTLHDTAHGLSTRVDDLSTHQSGSMVASAANGFGQIDAAPSGKSCTMTPYDFHPMYSTSSPQTRVPWAAHSYNIAFDYEIGHFDFCTDVNTAKGTCVGREGVPGDHEAADGDDNACFTAAQSTLVRVNGCLDSNIGFDGTSYHALWPDGNTRLHPTPVLFTSPLTGASYDQNYERAALESDTPRIEAPDVGGICNRTTGAGCTLVPPTDDGQPAAFYPFYSITGGGSSATAQSATQGCRWLFGNRVPGLTDNAFGGVSQYGTLLPQKFLVFGGGGATTTLIDDFRHIFTSNPCQATAR